MSDPVLLFMKPGAITSDDKAALAGVGVVVIEVEDPQAIKFTRASAEIEGGEMLRAAASAILESEVAQKAFAKALCAAIAAWQP